MPDEQWNKLEDDILSQFDEQTYNLIVWRYCMKCKSVRPPRAHHCSLCQRCVVRMDHHCPWVGNCVGLYNHKYFLMFVFHAMIGCVISATCMIYYCWQIGFKKMERTNTNFMIVMMVSGALIFSLGGLFGLHSYLIFTNGSTIEMAHLGSGNPFSRTRKVIKTSSERRARDPIRLFVGNQRAARMASKNSLTGNNQTKEVTNYWLNAADAMGYNRSYYFLPWAPDGDHPACDGFNWYIRTLH